VREGGGGKKIVLSDAFLKVEIGLAFTLKEDCASLPHGLSWLAGEYDDLETVEAIQHSLEEAGHRVKLLGDGERLVNGLLHESIDIVFNTSEGYGSASREAHAPALYEMLQKPYTHSNPHTLMLCQDKYISSLLMRSNGIPCPISFLASSSEDIYKAQDDIDFPMIVKPLHEGSSIGISQSSVVHNISQLAESVDRVAREYGQQALVEEYCEGNEYTVALLGNGDSTRCVGASRLKYLNNETKVLGITEKVDHGKYLELVPESTYSNIAMLAIATHRLFGCRDASRIDIRLKHNTPNVIDINPLPGLKPNYSLFPRISPGFTLTTIVNEILACALNRYGSLKG
jgi:D-alanine-D-alanine ligase